jgi:hypothetical protein
MHPADIIATVLVFLSLFLAYRVWYHWRRKMRVPLVRAIDSFVRSRSKDRAAMKPYFYVERARPLGILFSVVGILGLCATWIVAPRWFPGVVPEGFPRIVMTIICVSFVVVSVPALITGGSYRSRFDNGYLYWEYPNRFYGKSDSCCVEDVVEFQRIVSAGDSSASSYCLALKDGTRKCIQDQCFGDHREFARVLQEENPKIVFREKYL